MLIRGVLDMVCEHRGGGLLNGLSAMVPSAAARKLGWPLQGPACFGIVVRTLYGVYDIVDRVGLFGALHEVKKRHGEIALYLEEP